MIKNEPKQVIDCPNNEAQIRQVLHRMFDHQVVSDEEIDIRINEDTSLVVSNHTKNVSLGGGEFDETTMGDGMKLQKKYSCILPAGYKAVSFINAGTQSLCFSVESNMGNEYILKNEISPGKWNTDHVIYREFIGRKFMQYFEGKVYGPEIIKIGAKYIVETNINEGGGGGRLLKRRVLSRLPQKEQDDIHYAIAEMLYYMHFNYGKAARFIPYLLTEGFHKPFRRYEYEPIVGTHIADKFDEMMKAPNISFSQGDPHGENFIYKNKQLYLIDFGRCGKTDRRTDFATIYDFFGKDTAGAIIENYVLLHECGGR